jgi:hypothetical protein
MTLIVIFARRVGGGSSVTDTPMAEFFDSKTVRYKENFENRQISNQVERAKMSDGSVLGDFNPAPTSTWNSLFGAIAGPNDLKSAYTIEANHMPVEYFQFLYQGARLSYTVITNH